MDLHLRQATADDAHQIADLNGERNGPDGRTGALRVLDDTERYGPGAFTVVVDGDTVVSTLCLIRLPVRLGGVDLPFGRTEYVATHADYEGRGLVRRQMTMLHERSQDRGDVMQLITGIPFFYRQFGYEYALAYEPDVSVRLEGIAQPPGYTVREATDADIPAVLDLQARQQAGIDLVTPRDAHDFRWLWTASSSAQRDLVAERDDRIEGYAAVVTRPQQQRTYVFGGAFATHGAATALLAEAAREGGEVLVQRRQAGPLPDVLKALAHGPSRRRGGNYVRLPDAAAVLERLRPVLTGRLQRSPFAHASGSLLVSFYRHSVRLHYADGHVTAVEAGPGVQDPADEGGIGVPPDLAATLVLGKHGAAGLADRHPDVVLGDAEPLAEVLFPKLTTDLLLFD